MNEVRLALVISRAFSIGCSSVDPLDSLVALLSLTECDKPNGHDKSAEIMKARSLGIASCLIQWERDIPLFDLLDLPKTQRNAHDTQYSTIEQSLGLTSTQTIETLTQAADYGDSFAVFTLGVCSRRGYIEPQNKGNSVRLFQFAVDKGNADAMFVLADCYDDGNVVPQDKAKAIELYEQAADLGHVQAMVNLALCFDE